MRTSTWNKVLDVILAADVLAGIVFCVRYKSFFVIEVSPVQRIFFTSAILLISALALSLVVFRKQIIAKRVELSVSLVLFLMVLIGVDALMQARDTRQPIYTPHPYLSYSLTPGYRSVDGKNEHNSLGFRGSEITMPKPEGMFRIVLVGGSTVYETEVRDWHDDFARQLQRALNERYKTDRIEVINAGVGGYTSYESMIDLELRVLDTDPDLVIIYQNINDVIARLVKPEAYKSDNTGRRTVWNVATGCRYPLCSMILGRVLGISYFELSTDAPTLSAFQDGDAYDAVLGMRPSEALAANPPVYFERNTRTMIDVSRGRGVPVMLATWTQTDEIPGYTQQPYYRDAVIEQNEIIKTIGKEMHVPVFDFAPLMSKEAKYWADQVHNNEAGIALKSSLFAQFMYNDSSIRSLITRYLKSHASAK